MGKLIAVLIALLVLCSACTIVYHDEGTGQNDGLDFYFNDGSFDATGYTDNIWDDQLLPYAEEKATDISILIQELSADVDSAGSNYGFRSVDQGGAWNFIASGDAKVLIVNTESRNGLIELDLPPYDGNMDIKMQIGPVIKGTSIRDSMDFISFDDFTNQIEFSNLATELNKKAYATVLEPLTFQTGDEITFVGTFTFGSVEEINVMPLSLAVGGG